MPIEDFLAMLPLCGIAPLWDMVLLCDIVLLPDVIGWLVLPVAPAAGPVLVIGAALDAAGGAAGEAGVWASAGSASAAPAAT